MRPIDAEIGRRENPVNFAAPHLLHAVRNVNGEQNRFALYVFICVDEQSTCFAL